MHEIIASMLLILPHLRERRSVSSEAGAVESHFSVIVRDKTDQVASFSCTDSGEKFTRMGKLV